MRSQWKRLLIAAGLSLSSAGATVLWYHLTENRIDVGNATPLAQVSSVDDEVLRRPSTRLLWLPVNTGDNLYTGETIRTSSRGELQIQLLKGGSIKLEPDSLIVLQESKGQISLDLMEGSLFVDAKKDEAGADAAPKLVLNSKSGQVDLSGASASLSKGSGGRVDLQVLEGTATVQGANGQAKEVSSGRSSSLDASGAVFDNSNWKVLSPAPGRNLYINPEDEKPVTFRWQGVPSNWAVTLFAGETKKNMKEIGSAEAGQNELSVKLPLGKFWWRLSARDPQQKVVAEKSAPSRLEILARRTPVVTFPLADAMIPIERVPAEVTFKWEKLEAGTSLHLEVATDPALKNRIFNRQFRSEDQSLLRDLKEGEYYWRVSSSYEGDDKPVVGKIQRFTLERPGAREPVQFTWSLPAEKQVQGFATEPSLELKWEPKNRQDEIRGYRVRIENAQDPSVETQQFEAKSPLVKTKVVKAGRYIASIEAVGKDGQVLGRSSPQELVAQELPRLASPTLLPETGPLQSGFDGRTELQWKPLEGAKEYKLTIINKDGKTLATKSYREPKANLQNLMPGEYSVRLEAVDAWGRPGQEGETRTLLVPEKSNLKAPSLKRIKVN